MRSRTHLRFSRPAFVILVALIASAIPTSDAEAVTRSQVDAACSESRTAYQTYRTAQVEFQDATQELDRTNLQLYDAEYQEERIENIYLGRQVEEGRLREEIERQAAELYMQEVTSSGIGSFLFATPEQALLAVEGLKSSTKDTFRNADDLVAVSGELERLGGELDEVVIDRTRIRDAQEALTGRQQEAMHASLDAYDDLDDRCRELNAKYEAEQAQIRAEEEARRKREAAERNRASSGGSGGSSGGPSVRSTATKVVNGTICPFTPGRTSFSDTWGARRSGGRTHKGTDLFAPRGEPVYAVVTGRVSIRTGGLGGKTIWLTSTSGTAYYYAHLDSYAVSSGQSVTQGDLIATNGNTGNAIGTSPHVHFEIHPSGRGGAAINPYPTVSSTCF